MYLFTRRVQLASGHGRSGLAWAQEATEHANRITALGLGLYAQVFSPQVGTLVWSTFVEDLAQLEAAEDKLLADSGFQDLVERGAAHITGSTDDGLAQLVHGTPDPSRTVEYVSVVRSVCGPAGLAKGIDVGTRIARRATEVTGTPVLFAMEATGGYGGVAWLTPWTDLAALQQGEAALMGDPAWLALVDTEASAAYTDDPLATTQRIYRRLA